MEWTGARYADRPTVEVTTWVAAVPERVWPLVSDVTRMPEFSEELQSAHWVGGAREPVVGARFVGRNRHDALGEWETTCTVLSCDPGREFSWAVGDPAEPSAVWRFALEPGDGGTTLSQWIRMGPGRSGLSFAIDAMPEKEQKIVFVRLREFERGMTATLERIRQQVEA
ncbi:SRPBCC family protein [Streptomyces sp. NPDC029554]|uniref:SRPBCC family protein n=1 Tax=Streptomyces sp. NPDC029554 TaxID=3155126 RepID=UPI0033C4D42B